MLELVNDVNDKIKLSSWITVSIKWKIVTLIYIKKL